MKANESREVLIDRSMPQVWFFFALFIVGGWLIHHVLDSMELRCRRAAGIHCECLWRKYGDGLADYQVIPKVVDVDIRDDETGKALVLTREDNNTSELVVPAHLNMHHQLDDLAAGFAAFLQDGSQQEFNQTLGFSRTVQYLAWATIVGLLILFLVALWGKTVVLDRGRDLLLIKGGFRPRHRWQLTRIQQLLLDKGRAQLQFSDGSTVSLSGLTPRLQHALARRLNA